ncbi:MAG: alcohol dehydrogenase catalytic domain-containing protein, partial [Cyclobacteriaceae bacterium]|nr:alcohol dehydrogenase catalytic domain-containing protein [Cyclobacteriaceae bacterium]
MKVIQAGSNRTIGGLKIGEENEPVIGNNQMKIAVKAAGLNRADILQRMGHYPPPPSASKIMGLEVSGEIVEVGENVDGFRVGDRVLAGGGYAEFAVVDQGSVMLI